MRSPRFTVAGETGRGAAEEPEVEGREVGDRGGGGMVLVLVVFMIAKGDAGERVRGDGDEWGSSIFCPEDMRGERVGGVKYDTEPSRSREISEAPDDRLLGVLTKGCWSLPPSDAKRSEDEELAVDGREREDGIAPGSAIVGDPGGCGKPGKARPP